MPVKVLLVDDNQYERELCRIRLQRSELDVELLETGSGKLCLEMLAEDDSIDVVLLDLNMPDMSGEETLALIRQAHLQRPAVIILSGSEDPRADLSLAQGHLSKPLELDKFAPLLQGLGFNP